jgi:hypothetical protein
MHQNPQLHKEAQKLRSTIPPQSSSAGSMKDGKANEHHVDLATQASMVEPLSRGLERMQEKSSTAAAIPANADLGRRHYVDKLGEVSVAPSEDQRDATGPDQLPRGEDASLQRTGSRVSEPDGLASTSSDGRSETREERPFWKRKRSAKGIQEIGARSLRK